VISPPATGATASVLDGADVSGPAVVSEPAVVSDAAVVSEAAVVSVPADESVESPSLPPHAATTNINAAAAATPKRFERVMSLPCDA
jgi:hypothetical protein